MYNKNREKEQQNSHIPKITQRYKELVCQYSAPSLRPISSLIQHTLIQGT